MKAIVWTKNNCPFCVQAKNLLTLKGISYEERNINDGYDREDLFAAAPGVRTVPQIFIDDKHIGGFTELKKYFEQEQ